MSEKNYKSCMKISGYTICIIMAVVMIVSCSRCSAGFSGQGSVITIMSYNVENLFDDVDNGSEYREYDPEEGNWTTDHFHIKMMHIAEVVETALPGGPDVLALQEVENLNALRQLNYNYLKRMGYRYEILIPADGSAVNTALLSRVPVESLRTHTISVPGIVSLRNILEVKINWNNKPVVIFNNHWKSKLGGEEDTEITRVESAALILRRIKEIYLTEPETDIIVLGDLNENLDEYVRTEGKYQTALLSIHNIFPEEYSRKSILFSLSPDDTVTTADKVILYSPWNESENSGSYVYNNSWETIDHFFLNSCLFDNKGVSYNDFIVIKKDFIINSSGFPFGWNSSQKTGYSDHLPLLLSLSLE